MVLTPFLLLFLFSFHEADFDLWGRMAAGRLAVELGHVPKQDVFAYVPTKPLWVDHEWLSGRIFYEIHRLWGGAGLVFLRAAVGFIAIVFAYLAARQRGTARWATMLVLAAAWILVVQGFNTVVRAQSFSFAFFALFFYLLERARNGSTRLLLLTIPVTALWANLHGGFVTGVVLIFGYAAGSLFLGEGKRAARLAVLGIGCFATSILNPFGIDYWRYLAEALFMPRPEIIEWRPAELSIAGDIHVLIALLFILLVWVVGKKIRPDSDLMVLGAAVAATLHIRFTPFLGLTMAALLSSSVEEIFTGARRAFPIRPARSLAPVFLMVLLLSLTLIGTFVTWRQSRFELDMHVPSEVVPIEAVEILKNEPGSGRLAVFFNWGEYALYHLYPRYRVSVDGRYETVYPNDIIAANWRFTHGIEGSERFLRDHPADFALYPQESGAADWLSSAADWKLVHENDLAVLYRRGPDP
jgi:hypothetical protein